MTPKRSAPLEELLQTRQNPRDLAAEPRKGAYVYIRSSQRKFSTGSAEQVAVGAPTNAVRFENQSQPPGEPVLQDKGPGRAQADLPHLGIQHVFKNFPLNIWRKSSFVAPRHLTNGLREFGERQSLFPPSRGENEYEFSSAGLPTRWNRVQFHARDR